MVCPYQPSPEHTAPGSPRPVPQETIFPGQICECSRWQIQ